MSIRSNDEMRTSDSRGQRLRRAFVLPAILCAAAFAASPALAQKGQPVPEQEKVVKSYTLPYFFSGLAVLMVVVPLCFPSMRKTEAPKGDDD